MDQVGSWLERHHIGLTTVLATFAVLVGAAILIVLVNRLLKGSLRRAETRLSLRPESIVIVARTVTTALWTLTFLVVLEMWGVDMVGLWAILASVATLIGVGFLANWAMISNMTASVFLAVWRPFRLGDTVEMLPEKLKGRAVDRNLMFTALREDNGATVQIPNNLFFQKMFRVGGSE